MKGLSMNFHKLFHRKSLTLRLSTALVLFTFMRFESTGAERYSDACRSIHGRLGQCVPLASCPLFYGWLKVRPLVKENLRLLVRYTCYFDTRNPKVCCPNDNLYQSEPEPVGFRVAPVRRGIQTSQKGLSPNRLLFPEPHQVSNGGKSHLHPESPPPTEHKQEHVPLSFPNEQHPQNERGFSWSATGKSSKDSQITRKTGSLATHPNFRLIPKLDQCSNALKLDSVIESTYGVYPWIALVGLKPGRQSLDFEHVCSGAIISNRYILTAAHCFDRANPRYVRLGEYDLDAIIDGDSPFLPQSIREDHPIEKKTIHPHYNSTTGANNIALIRLEKPLALNTTFIRTICLPFVTEYGLESKLDVNSDMSGKSGWVAGWGHHSMDGVYTKGSETRKLQQGFVDFTSHETCRQDYPSILSPFSSRTQLCVGGKGRRSTCISDSGGPLIFPTKVPGRVPGFKEAKFFLLGLHSRGPTGPVCHTVSEAKDEETREIASRVLPSTVFTRISKYLGWILDNMQE